MEVVGVGVKFNKVRKQHKYILDQPPAYGDHKPIKYHLLSSCH